MLDQGNFFKCPSLLLTFTSKTSSETANHPKLGAHVQFDNSHACVVCSSDVMLALC